MASLGNKRQKRIPFSRCLELGHSHSGTIFFAVLFHLMVFLWWVSTRALHSLGCDVSRSKPAADCSEQGAALAASIRV